MFDLNDLQIRATVATVEGIDEDTGLVDAKLAAYEVEAELEPGLVEVFTRGAFGAACGNPSRVKVSNQGHDRRTIIGHAVELRDETDGLYGSLRIPPTSWGRDVLELLRSGTLTDLSVEFRPQKRHVVVARREGGGVLVRHNKATLVGVSPVALGAYGQEARVLSVREAARDYARERALAQLSTLVSGSREA